MKVINHGPAIMRYQNTAFMGSVIQDFAVAETIQLRFLRRGEIDREFTSTDILDYAELEVVVGLKANAQECSTDDAAALAR
jgi:hypothetical protein